ncbi:hypothetical protein M3G91_27925 [Micromonospora chalcea]|uniref:hypothetical protein n=1 Tax=Micromonospora chalcea TaxID=1874 RepID=UPI0021A6EA82|nr:hypothetical protein [Micromonospora chalcea]MCT2281436.1 hypothetical protein [Micromonospora chalcea]
MDELRRAMRATERAGGLDLDDIMRRGRRLRRRRRTGAAMAAVTAVVAVAFGVEAVVTRPGPPNLPAGEPVVTASTGTPPPTPTAAPAPTEPPPRPLGTVVGSGIRYGADERVFYVVPVDVPELPRVSIGLVAGRRAPDGRLTTDFLVNDVSGSDRRPGFHEIGYDQQRVPTDTSVPTFGYFVGPAARIVGTVDGRQVEATLARWSEDPELVIFWFDPRTLTPGTPLDGITARDPQGRRL